MQKRMVRIETRNNSGMDTFFFIEQIELGRGGKNMDLGIPDKRRIRKKEQESFYTNIGREWHIMRR